MAKPLRPFTYAPLWGAPAIFFLLMVGSAFAQAPPSTDGIETAATSSGPSSSSTEPDAPTVSFSADMTAASRYLFQGFDYSEGRAVVQPNVALQVGSLTANVWGNYHVDRGELDEVDVSLKVDRSFGKLSITTGYMNLQYPNRVDWAPSQEVFLDLGLEAPLSPTLSVHYDFDEGSGTYSTLGLAHSIGTSLSFATNVFYLGRYYDQTGFSAAEIKASWERSIGAYTFTPAVSYFATWSNGDFTDDQAVPSNWLFAINVGRAF